MKNAHAVFAALIIGMGAPVLNLAWPARAQAPNSELLSPFAQACREKMWGALGNALKLPEDGRCLYMDDDEYVRFSDPVGEKAYPEVDGKAIKRVIGEITAISRKSRDDGNQYWGRIPGTPYDKMTRDWVEAQFRAIGLQDVRQQDIAMPPLWYPASWKASFAVDGRTVEFRSVFPINDTRGTAASGVEGDAVWVGLGTAADFKGRDVRGKSVFIYSVPTPGGRDHSAEWNEAMKRASEAGAASVFVVMGIPGDAQSNPEGADHLTSPTVTISSDEADGVREAIEQGKTVSVRLTLNVEHREGLKTANVWGVLPGTSDEQVIVMAHTDCFFEGALDNASGIAAMLAIARHYAAVPKERRRRTMVFLTTPDHHHGAVGIKWIRDHYDFGKVALIANSEHPSQSLLYWFSKGLMTGTGVNARRWFAGGSDALRRLVKDSFRTSGVATYRMAEFRPGGELQHVYTKAPSFEIIDHVIYHTTLDTEALVPAVGLQEAVRAYLKIIDAANEMSISDLRAVKSTH